MGGIMTSRHRDAHAREISAAVCTRVASRDRNAPPNQQLRQPAHPGAGDPNEVNRALIGGIDERHVLAARI
jgi:hypothetical protein